MKKTLIAILMALGLLILAGCSEVADQDRVGIWITAGQLDGSKFDHCIPSGEVDEVAWNDDVYWVENNLRTWNAGPSGGDTDVPLTLTAKPDVGQQTGLQVNVWTQTNFKLNTYCGADDKDANSPLAKWWQNLGDRYDADQPEGWRKMLLNTVVPALEKAKNVLRVYTADELIIGTVWTDAEKKFAETFTAELLRLAGQNYFCGPTFDRLTGSLCPPIAVSIKDVDLADPGVQAARNEKQKALETAAAQVAEAEGKVKAANAQSELYRNAQWMALEQAKIQLQIAQACAASAKCTMVLDSSGNVQVHTS